MNAFHSSLVLIMVSLVSPRPFSSEDEPVLAKVQPKTGSPVVGQLLKETDAEILLLDLRTGRQVTVSKRDILRSTTNLTDKEAIAVAGLPSFLAWRIKGSSPLEPPKGKVAKASSAGLFVTLGAKSGVEPGQKLVVLRDEGEIKDPDSGKVLGRQQVEIARIEVTDVEQDFSRAKTIGEVKIELRPGDAVEPLGAQKLIATLPLVNTDGEETEGGRKLSEELTTGLVGHGIRLVERSLLSKALEELRFQQTELVNPSTAQKLGKQVGAYGILCGTIVSEGRVSQAHVRLIEVETGEILFASQQNLSGRNATLKNQFNGSILSAPPDLTQYWIDRGQRRSLGNVKVSEQLFYSNRQVPKGQDVINSIPEGNKLTLANRLVQSTGDGRLYLLDQGKKRLITEKALKIHPFNPAKATAMSPNELAMIPDGPSLECGAVETEKGSRQGGGRQGVRNEWHCRLRSWCLRRR